MVRMFMHSQAKLIYKETFNKGYFCKIFVQPIGKLYLTHTDSQQTKITFTQRECIGTRDCEKFEIEIVTSTSPLYYEKNSNTYFEKSRRL